MATTGMNNTTTVEAEITILNPDDFIILGLDAKVVIHTASVHDVLTIPNLAVNADTEGKFVFVVEDNRIVKKHITTGVSDVTDCEILSGIDADAMVVTDITAMTTEQYKNGIPVIPLSPDADVVNGTDNSR